MIENAQQLGAFLKAAANQRELELAFDTHYDAQNWELSWWQGATLHRLDFQPLRLSEVSITHYKDRFQWFPRILRWAHNAIPMFPYLARTEWSNLVTVRFPLQENDVASLVSESVTACPANEPDRLERSC